MLGYWIATTRRRLIVVADGRIVFGLGWSFLGVVHVRAFHRVHPATQWWKTNVNNVVYEFVYKIRGAGTLTKLCFAFRV